MARQEALATARDLLNRGNRLRRMARELAAEYDIPMEELLDSDQSGQQEANGAAAPVPSKGQATENGEAHEERKAGRKGQRMGELIEFLRQHGPMTSQSIIDQTGLPAGTVYRLLRSEQFENDEHHRWHLVGVQAG